jgi:hypothetical protein
MASGFVGRNEEEKWSLYDGVPQQQWFQGFFSDFFHSLTLARCAHIQLRLSTLTDFPINFHATLECHSAPFSFQKNSVFERKFLRCHKTFCAFLLSFLFSFTNSKAIKIQEETQVINLAWISPKKVQFACRKKLVAKFLWFRTMSNKCKCRTPFCGQRI